MIVIHIIHKKQEENWIKELLKATLLLDIQNDH